MRPDPSAEVPEGVRELGSRKAIGLVCSPVGDQFRMQATERFGDVAVPTYGPVGGQGVLKTSERDLGPRQGLALFVDHRRRMIVPMDFAKRLATIDTLHAWYQRLTIFVTRHALGAS